MVEDVDIYSIHAMIQQMNNVDASLGCIRRPWSANGESDHSHESLRGSTTTKKRGSGKHVKVELLDSYS